MLLLDNPIQNYAWGSRTSLAKLLGRPPSAQPEAELWIGAHPKAPSLLEDGRSLLAAIVSDPDRMLGSAVHERFGAQLPFLLKVLAVDSPLSLQAHPNLEQAARGFAREELAGVPLGAPERTYKDENHKPELLCALTPFEALSGFRPPAEAAALFEGLGVTSTDVAAQLRQRGPEPHRAAFATLMSLSGEARAKVTSDVLSRCERARAGVAGPFAASINWACKLAAQYPGDIGAVASLLLNHLALAPLEAVYLEAGRLHAYLSGTGVEIMANSDNVLRGGLTPKHVDVPELLRVLVFDSPQVLPTPTHVSPAGEITYLTPAPEFRLSRIDLPRAGSGEGQGRFAASVSGPEILLCVEGQVGVELSSGPVALGAGRLVPHAGLALGSATRRVLGPGKACFLPASAGAYELEGKGRIFRATLG